VCVTIGGEGISNPARFWVSKNNIHSTGTATFSVTALRGSDGIFNAGANHDPDGDAPLDTVTMQANP